MPHLRNVWYSSNEFFEDIKICGKGRKKQSKFFEGIYDYWIGYINNEPFCLLMLADMKKILPDTFEFWPHLFSKRTRNLSVEMMIGNTSYLGKRIAGPTLEMFCEYYCRKVELTERFIAYIESSNETAIKTYAKAGFKIAKKFKMRYGDFESSAEYWFMIKNFGK